MLDTSLLRNKDQAREIAKELLKKNFTFELESFELLESQRKQLQIETQTIQNTRNQRSKEIGRLKGAGKPIEPLLAEVANLKASLESHEHKLQALQEKIKNLLLPVPNIPHHSVPVGKNENDNIEIKRWGEKREFSFIAKEHFAVAGINKAMDFEAAAKLSGARFVVLRSDLAGLHRALGQFMLDLHIQEHGYEEVYVPYLVGSHALFGTGQFPKLRDDTFGIADQDLWLIPTAEVPVANLVREQILSNQELPLKFACYSPSFRKEAGSYGKDTRWYDASSSI